jgi:hydroxyacylglutathione hydrolase
MVQAASAPAVPQLPDCLTLDTRVVGAFAENTYVLACADTRVCFIVDPGGDAPDIAALIAKHDLKPAAILLTHAHIDHVAGINDLRRLLAPAFGELPVYLHPGERDLAESAPMFAQLFGLPAIETPVITDPLLPGVTMDFGQLKVSTRLTDGHSPAGLSLVVAHADAPDAPLLVFSGDALFQGSIGRTDLPGGDLAKLLAGIDRELMTLPDETIVLSGHGPATTIGRERRFNPFLNGRFM